MLHGEMPEGSFPCNETLNEAVLHTLTGKAKDTKRFGPAEHLQRWLRTGMYVLGLGKCNSTGFASWTSRYCFWTHCHAMTCLQLRPALIATAVVFIVLLALIAILSYAHSFVEAALDATGD